MFSYVACGLGIHSTLSLPELIEKEAMALEANPLEPHEALRELLHHWYGARFGRQVLQVMGITTYFLQCANLANHVSICRLKRPLCLSALPELARFVEEDLACAL